MACLAASPRRPGPVVRAIRSGWWRRRSTLEIVPTPPSAATAPASRCADTPTPMPPCTSGSSVRPARRSGARPLAREQGRQAALERRERGGGRVQCSTSSGSLLRAISVLRVRAEQQFAKGAAAVRDHHDQVAAVFGGGVQDGVVDAVGALEPARRKARPAPRPWPRTGPAPHARGPRCAPGARRRRANSSPGANPVGSGGSGSTTKPVMRAPSLRASSRLASAARSDSSLPSIGTSRCWYMVDSPYAPGPMPGEDARTVRTAAACRP